MNTISIAPCNSERGKMPHLRKASAPHPGMRLPAACRRLAAALRRFVLRDGAAADAADIAAGVVPPSRRYDRALVNVMQRQAMEGGAQ